MEAVTWIDDHSPGGNCQFGRLAKLILDARNNQIMR